MTDDTLLIDVLRAAGHEDAADLCERLAARGKPAAETPNTPAETAKARALSPAEAERVAEGDLILAAMKRELPGLFT